MKRFGSFFPFLEQGPRHAHIGRLVANAGFIRALLASARFDEFVFGSPSRTNLLEFRDVVAGWMSPAPRPVRYVDVADWPQLLSRDVFHVMHLGGWGHFMPGLHYLRSQLAPTVWPMTAVIHSLHGRETIDHAVRLVSAGLLPCDAVFCTSRDGRTALERLLDGAQAIVGRRFNGQLLLAPLGVDDELLDVPGERDRGRQRLRIAGDALVALVLGRMSPAQKMDLGPLCRVVAQEVRPRVTRDFVLVFAGGATPGELELLQDAVGRHGLADAVRFQANFAPEQKRDVLAMADVLVAPTDNTQETFGLSLLEAQAAGLPVVASRYDGYKDLVEDGVDGFLVDTWQAPADLLDDWFDVMDGRAAQLLQAQSLVVDLPQLADRLVRLLNDDAMRRRMGEAGRQKVAGRYTWSRVIGQYESLWDELAVQASRIGRQPPERNPYALGPMRVFGHYASHTLQPASVVVATATRIEDRPYREAAGWLSPPLLADFLRRAARPIQAGDLAAGAAVPAGHAWFALAWLLKYGLLRLDSGPEAAHARTADADSFD